jgi:hypothetical protein
MAGPQANSSYLLLSLETALRIAKHTRATCKQTRHVISYTQACPAAGRLALAIKRRDIPWWPASKYLRVCSRTPPRMSFGAFLALSPLRRSTATLARRFRPASLVFLLPARDVTPARGRLAEIAPHPAGPSTRRALDAHDALIGGRGSLPSAGRMAWQSQRSGLLHIPPPQGSAHLAGRKKSREIVTGFRSLVFQVPHQHCKGAPGAGRRTSVEALAMRRGPSCDPLRAINSIPPSLSALSCVNQPLATHGTCTRILSGLTSRLDYRRETRM